jgi:hypothetical protein
MRNEKTGRVSHGANRENGVGGRNKKVMSSCELRVESRSFLRRDDKIMGNEKVVSSYELRVESRE